MSRTIFLFLISIFFSTLSNAQSLSLVKKDEWGGNAYKDALLIGKYIYAKNRDRFLDVLDPEMPISEQLVGRVDLEPTRLGTWGRGSVNFNGFIAVSVFDKVAIYSLVNPTAPELIFEVDILGTPKTELLVQDNKLYIVALNELTVVENTAESEIKVLKTYTLEDYQTKKVREYQVILEPNSLIIHQVEKSNNDASDYANDYVLREYDISNVDNIFLKNKLVIPKVSYYRHSLNESENKIFTYLGQHHIAIRKAYENEIEIYDVKDGELTLVSVFAINNTGDLSWQEETKQLRILSVDSRTTYRINSYSEPIFENKLDTTTLNKVYRFHQFIDETNALVSSHNSSNLAMLDLTNQNTLTFLNDHSGGISDMTLKDSSVYVGKKGNIHRLNIEDNKLKFVNKFNFGNPLDVFRHFKIQSNVFYATRNKTIMTTLEFNENEMLELKHESEFPDSSLYYGYNVINGKYDTIHLILGDINPGLYWYDRDIHYNYILPPSYLDLTSYSIADGVEVKKIQKGFFVNGYLAISVLATDGNYYLLLVKKIGDSILEITDTLNLGSTLTYFFVDNNVIYKAIRKDSHITSFKISPDDKLEQVDSKSLPHSSRARVIANGLFFGNYLIIHTYNAIKVYDYSQATVKFIDSSSINYLANNNFHDADMALVGNNLIINQSYRGIISLYEINKAPQVESYSIEINEDEELVISDLVLDAEGDEIEYSIVNLATNGELIIAEDKLTLSYIPNLNYVGDDSFTFRATDNHGNFVEQEMLLSILPINDAPTLITEELLVDEDNILTADIIAEDVDGDDLTFKLTTEAQFGTVAITDSGQLTYQPNTNFFGSDSVEVSVTDTAQAAVTAEITITVAPVNDIPVITSIAFDMKEDKVLSNQLVATDVESQNISFSLVESSVRNGEVRIEQNGSFIFMPTSEFNGEASFSVQATDSEQGVHEQIVLVNVEAVEDTPIAENASASLAFGGSHTGSLSATDSDGDALTFIVIEDVKNGTLSLSSDGSYTYQANASFSGADSFIYQVTDTKDNAAQATVTLTVQAKPPEKESTSSSSGGSVHFILSMFLIIVFGYRRQKFVLK